MSAIVATAAQVVLLWWERRKQIKACPQHVMYPGYHSWYCKNCPYEERD